MEAWCSLQVENVKIEIGLNIPHKLIKQLTLNPGDLTSDPRLFNVHFNRTKQWRCFGGESMSKNNELNVN